jgi:hypothetical protein
MEIVQFRGKIGPYLEPASGRPTFSLSKMVREDLQVDLRDALGRARKENRPVRKEALGISLGGPSSLCRYRSISVRGANGRRTALHHHFSGRGWARRGAKAGGRRPAEAGGKGNCFP